jgi:hypothetical protein
MVEHASGSCQTSRNFFVPFPIVDLAMRFPNLYPIAQFCLIPSCSCSAGIQLDLKPVSRMIHAVCPYVSIVRTTDIEVALSDFRKLTQAAIPQARNSGSNSKTCRAYFTPRTPLKAYWQYPKDQMKQMGTPNLTPKDAPGLIR